MQENMIEIDVTSEGVSAKPFTAVSVRGFIYLFAVEISESDFDFVHFELTPKTHLDSHEKDLNLIRRAFLRRLNTLGKSFGFNLANISIMIGQLLSC